MSFEEIKEIMLMHWLSPKKVVIVPLLPKIQSIDREVQKAASMLI
jgi:hypothetical protein